VNVSRQALSAMAGAALLVLAVAGAQPAHAHQPVVLTAADTTPARGPLLVDGTVSFAVYANVRSGTSRGFRVGLRQGDRLEIQLLIPDQAPANRLPASQLPIVRVTAPDGTQQRLPITERTPFFEPYSGTEYLYLARLTAPASRGIYRVVVTGASPTETPVVIGVGYREVPGEVR
jgi:hypothetical protein